MTAPESVVQAVMKASDCAKVRDEHIESLTPVYYCSRHMCGWLRDRDCCAHIEPITDAAFAASLEWAAENLRAVDDVVSTLALGPRDAQDLLRRWARGDR